MLSNLVLKGKLREAIRFVSEREKGGVFQPEKIAEDCTGTINKNVTLVLEEKNPSKTFPSCAMLKTYEEMTIFFPVIITEESVESKAQNFRGNPAQEARTLRHYINVF